MRTSSPCARDSIASIGISDSQVVAHQDVMIGLVIMLPTSAAFHPSAALPLRHSLLPQLAITSCISDDDDKPLPLETSSDLFASLRARQSALDKNLEARWKKAECKSQVGLVLENWIRRISLDWPRCAVGSAEGSVYVADLTSGEVLTKAFRVHPARVPGPAAERDMQMLHGDYDGGGLTALAMRGDRVVSAGRDGNCQLWRVEEEELASVSELSTGAAIVSAIELSGGAIWCASLDGHLRKFDDDADVGSCACSLDLTVGAPCLSLAVCEEASLVAVGTSEGAVELFSASDGAHRGTWRPLEGSAARSVAIASVKGERCVITGGMDGAMHLRYLASGDVGLGFDESQQGEPMLPSHQGPCVALTPLDGVRDGGLLVSGAHDGTLRVWDLADGRVDGIPSASGPKCLYGLGGYKVWLGSVCSDGLRLVSDGRDNALVVHDFGEETSSDIASL